MKYTLRIAYKSGASHTVPSLNKMQLRCEITERLIDNQNELSVEKWEIIPEEY